jgi:DNA-binding transcriptional MocR family regulator
MLELAFRSDPHDPAPVYRQLAGFLRAGIESGHIGALQKLPASRDLAESLGLGRNTVTRAYELIVDSGHAVAHVGQGTFVTRRTGHRVDGAAPALPRGFAWEGLFSLASRSVTLPPALLSSARARPRFDFRPGQVDRASLPVGALQRAFSTAISRQLRVLAEPAHPFGWPPLRAAIAASLCSRGIACSAEDVLVVAGAQHGLDLLARVLLDPGDTVVMEQPGYFGAALAFQSRQANLVGVGVDEEGLRTGELARLLRARRAKLVFTTPAVQSPTGVVLSESRRRELLSIADEHQLPIIEDDYDGELRLGGPAVPALKTLDRAGQVIYLGTFSKALLPGLRLGYLVADRALLARIAVARVADSLQSPVVTEAAMTELLASGALERHVRRVRRRHLERRDALLAALGQELPRSVHVTKPAGGTSVWLTLPGVFDGEALEQEARACGVGYLRGDAFFTDGRGRESLLLSFANVFPDEIRAGAERLGKAVRKVLAVSPAPSRARTRSRT